MSKGGIIGTLNDPNPSKASGIWKLREHQNARKVSNWPTTVMPLTFYSSSSYATPSGTLETISWTHNVEPNASCLVAVVSASAFAGMTGSTHTMTVNGIAMTLVDVLESTNNLYVYILYNPPKGIVTLESVITGVDIDRNHAGHSATFAGVSSVNATNKATTGNQITTLNLITTVSSMLLISSFIQREGTSSAFTASLTAPTPNYTLQSRGVGVNVYRLTSMWTTDEIAAANTTITVTASLGDSSIAVNHIVAIALAA